MAWKQNPETGESYQVEDPRPGEGTETGYQNPNAPGRKRIPKFNQSNWKPPAPAAAPPLPPLPPGAPPPVAPPVQPISFNGGHYNPTTAPHGWDQSQPGQVEQMWGNNQALWFQSPQLDWVDAQQGKFENPWQGEQQVSGMLGSFANPGAGQQYWNGAQGEFNRMGSGLGAGYTGPNNAQAAFDMTKGMLPGSMQPKFDAHYDRMSQKAMSNVNSQSAARGAYGSSAGLNGAIGAGLDIEAQRAKAHTDFMLADSANQRAWQDTLGTQGRNADLTGLDTFGSKLEGAKFGLDKFKAGGEMAFEAEQMDYDKKKSQAELAFDLDGATRDRLGAGIETAFESSDRRRGQVKDAFDAAGQVDDSRNERINGLYDRLSGFGTDVQNFVMENHDLLLSGDQAASDQAIEAMLAEAAQAQGWDERQIERVRRDVKDAIDAIPAAKKAKVI